MCGPPIDYTFDDFLNDASEEEWAQWEYAASILEIPVDYYVLEFI